MIIGAGCDGREVKTAQGQLRDLVASFDSGFDVEDV
jgi:hypothetical protein